MSTSEPVGTPPGYTLPFGLVSFELRGVPLGSTQEVTVFMPSVAGVSGYLKPIDVAPYWGAMPSDRVVVDASRNAVVVTLTDGGVGDRDGVANGVIVDPGGAYTGDGIVDALQPSGTPELAFRDTSTTPETFGRLVNANGLITWIEDAPGSAGVVVTVGTGTGSAEFHVCGSTVLVDPGSRVVLTCGSVIVSPVTGSAAVVLADGDRVTVSAGSSVEVEDASTGAILTNVVGSGVTVTVDGTPTPVPAGAGPFAIDAAVITGFTAPVDNTPTVNVGKAGRAVPVKWHLANFAGQPVTDLAAASITVEERNCSTNDVTDTLETTLTGGSALQNLGSGDYQMNWKTSATWAGKCTIMTLDVGDGLTKQAFFKFTK